ncbi:MAG: hypothetical protein IJO48_04565, partial [Clostridia bacterium]|nr:hypothetical protein [Clostridia bacterium]
PVSVCFQMAEPIYHNYTPVEIRSLADTSLQYIRTDTNTKLDIIYCCDMNAFMNKAPIGTFLKRTNLNELGFDWHSITATDVGAAKFKHDHGNISSSGAVGTQSNLPIFTGANGVIQTKSIDEARSLLNISDELDIGALQQSLPILTRQTTAEVVTVSDINTDIGYMHIMLKGKLIASKPDPTAEISPSNIATISHVKPDMLYIDNLDGEELAKVDLSDTPVVWGIGEACDTVDIQTGSVISRINKLILKGTEQWNYTAADDGGAPFFTYTLSGSSMPAYEIANLMCTHFESVPYADRTTISSDNTLTGVSAGNGMLNFRPPTMETDFPSLTEWEAFLAEQYAANTPVTVYYETEFGYEAGGSSVTVPVPAENMRIYTDAAILLDVKYALNTKEFSGIAEDYNGTDKTVTSISDCFEYHFGTLNKLTVIPEALPQSHYSFSMYFNSGDNISVSLPSQIRWAGGTAPTFLANKTYELSVKDNLGKLEVYEIE